jgi:hypothetical protein
VENFIEGMQGIEKEKKGVEHDKIIVPKDNDRL